MVHEVVSGVQAPAGRGGRAARPLGPAVLCALLAALGPGGGAAQAVRELTVEGSVRMGLEHNARLRAAHADAEAARAGERQVGAARLPALRSQASYGRLSSNIPPVEFTLPGSDSTFTFQGV
jgi:outer membrane protein TolC